MSGATRYERARLKWTPSLQGQEIRRVLERAQRAAQGGVGESGVNLSKTQESHKESQAPVDRVKER